MHFNMNRAWDEAVRIMRANPELLALLAGLFIFLPTFAIYLAVPEAMSMPANMTQETASTEMNAWMQRNALYVILLQVVQYIGILSMLALFARRKPTVGEAIKNAFIALLPLLAAQILLGLAFGLAGSLLIALGSALGSAGVFVMTLFVIGGAIYVAARLFALLPIVIFEKIYNPLKAIGDAWRLTKGQGFRLLAFFALLIIAAIVISAVLSGIAALIGAIASEQAALFVQAGFSALFAAISSAIFTVVIVALYRQFGSRKDPEARLPGA